MNFLEQLVKKGIINRYQMEEIIEKARSMNGDIDRALASENIPSDVVRTARAELSGLPERAIDFQKFSFDVLKYIPEDAAMNYRAVPIGITRGVLDVGLLDPGNVSTDGALQFISSKINMPIERFVISFDDFQKIIEGYHGAGVLEENEGGNQNSLADEILDVPSDEKIDQDVVTGADGSITEDAPATKMIGVIVKNAIDGGASDIHIEHAGNEVRVRYRVDGILHTSLRPNKSFHGALIAKIKTLANLKLDEKRKPQDGRFVAVVDKGTPQERKVDFRVSTLPTFYGEKAVIRILDPDRGVKTLGDVGFSAEHLEMIRKALERPYGLVLLTGPTGSGKTTTLYAMIKEIDREKLNVVSLEDPIEYNIPGMNQSQVRPEIGYDFANGLRSILRQDPDVIMVGEIRDKETAKLAIQAALTGHLVFATLHTNNAIGVVPRLVDMGVDPYLIAPTLILAMAQRLVQKLVPNTGKAIPVDGAIAEMIEHEFNDLPPQFIKALPITNKVYEAQKSDVSESGLHGRLPVFEMFAVDKEVEKIILSKPDEGQIYDYVRKQGMITMREDAILKCMQGKIPWNEVNTL